MKKILLILFSVLLLSTSCTKKKPVISDINIEEVTKMDKAQMPDSFIWYETLIIMDDYLDQNAEKPVEAVNIFQAIVDGDPMVYKFQHFRNGTTVKDSIRSFWIEDYPIKDDSLITFNKAFELIKEVNLPKPHSRHVCLRNPMGPLETNPQWVFGNIESQLWVNTKTGEIKTSNPAFPEDFEFKY